MVREPSAASAPSTLSDAEVERYSRQLLVPGFSERQQLRLGESRVVIIGCGGLGGPAGLYLAGAGVGRIDLVDPDLVALDNLHRQVAYRTADVGRPKVVALAEALVALNPTVRVRAFQRALGDASFDEILGDASVIVECSDSPGLKFAVNDWAVALGIPLVVGGAIGWTGQVTTVLPGGGCFRCLFGGPSEEMERSCRSSGVIGPLVGVIGALQAQEVVLVLGGGGGATSRLTDFDAQSGRWRTLTVATTSECSVHRLETAARP